MKIWVTSVGTGAAVSAIKALRKVESLNPHIIGSDVDRYSAGLRLVDTPVQSLKYDHPEYIDFLVKNCISYGASILIPTYSKEIEVIAKQIEQFQNASIKVLIPNHETVALCHDKSRFALAMADLGVRVPQQYKTQDAFELLQKGVSLFSKPNHSSGSIGTMQLDCVEDLEYAIRKNSNLLIQELITGKEVTVDVFVDRNNEPLVISPRERIAVKSGQSVKAKTLDPKQFSETVRKICKEIKLVGPCNFQFMVESTDVVTLIEINPRFASGGLMLTLEAGVNIPHLLVKLLMDQPISSQECAVKPGHCMSRYWEEVFWSE